MGFMDGLNNFSQKGGEVIYNAGEKFGKGVDKAKAKAREVKADIGEMLGGTNKSQEKPTDIRDTTLGKALSQGYLGEDKHRRMLETGDPGID